MRRPNSSPNCSGRSLSGTRVFGTSAFSTSAFAIGAVSLLSTLVVPDSLWAQGPQVGRVTGSISVGTEILGEGDLHGSATSTIPSLTALNPAIANVPADLVIESRKFSDVYDDPLGIGLELSYGASDNVELFAGLNYSKSDEARTQIGVANVAALNAVLPVYGDFGELVNFGAEGGARLFFPGETWRPFVGGSVGFVRQDAINTTVTIPDAPEGGITLSNVAFFEDSTTFTVGAEAGLSFSFTEALGGRISAGAKYIGEFEGDDTGLSGLGLSGINDGTERWVYPIKASISMRF
jgi:hypothetical protein